MMFFRFLQIQLLLKYSMLKKCKSIQYTVSCAKYILFINYAFKKAVYNLKKGFEKCFGV
jgi:hypothetical protein